MTEPMPPFTFPRLDDMRRLLELANALHACAAPDRAQRLASETAVLLAAESVAVRLRSDVVSPWALLAGVGEPPPDETAADDGPPHEVGLLPGGDGRPSGVRSVMRQGGRVSAVSAWRRAPFEPGHVDLLRLLHPAACWVLDGAAARAGLTAGAEAVLTLMLTGLPEKEIARRLSRSVHTVHTHIKRVYRHYGVNSRPELLARRYDRRDPPPG